MRGQGVIVVVLLAIAAGFGLLNRAVLLEPRSMRLPGATVEGPLGLDLLLAAAAALVFLFLIQAVMLALEARRRHRLEAQLREREREIAEMKSRAYDRLSVELQAARHDLSERLDALARHVAGLREPAATDRAAEARTLDGSDGQAASQPDEAA
jgi:hypothetical protein